MGGKHEERGSERSEEHGEKYEKGELLQKFSP
jgi:hypothetical protein